MNNSLGNALKIVTVTGALGLGGCAGVYVEGAGDRAPGRSSSDDQCRRTEEPVNGRLTVTAEQCRERRREEAYQIINGQRVRVVVERSCNVYRRLVNGVMQTVSRECEDEESVRPAPYYQRPYYSPPPYRSHRRSCNILKRGFNCSDYDPQEDGQDIPLDPLAPGFQPYYDIRYRDDTPSA